MKSHQKLKEALSQCIVIDIETTGLDPRNEKIIEIAATKMVNGHATDTFHSLINPGRSLSTFITDLTGISDGLLLNAPSFSDIAEDLYRFLLDDSGTSWALVGHNVEFDYSFLQHEFLRAELAADMARTPYTPHLVCTAATARELISREKVGRYRLENLASLLNTRHRPHHRAQADVLATIDVAHALANITAMKE